MYSRVTLAYSEQPQQKVALDEDAPSPLNTEDPPPAGDGDPACGSDEHQADARTDTDSTGNSGSQITDLAHAESGGAPSEGLPPSIQGQAGDTQDVANASAQGKLVEAHDTDARAYAPLGQGVLLASSDVHGTFAHFPMQVSTMELAPCHLLRPEH